MSKKYESTMKYSRFSSIIILLILLSLYIPGFLLIIGSLYLAITNELYFLLITLFGICWLIFLTIMVDSARPSPIEIYETKTIVSTPKFLMKQYNKKIIKHENIDGFFFFRGHIVILVKDMKFFEYSIAPLLPQRKKEYKKMVNIYKNIGIKYFTRSEFFRKMDGRRPLTRRNT